MPGHALSAFTDTNKYLPETELMLGWYIDK